MNNKILIQVYCGTTVEDKCINRHPYNEVIKAQKIVERNKSTICYSNSPDFVTAIKHLCDKNNIETEFFLNNISQGSDIEPIFKDFNRALELINNLI